MGPGPLLWAALIAGTAAMVLCVLVVVRLRRNAAGAWLTVALLACVWWSLAYLLELQADDAAGRTLWGGLKYVGVATLAPAWLLFTLRYTGTIAQVRPWHVAVLAVEPVCLWTLLAVPATRPLVRSYPDPDSDWAEVGAAFWFHIAYAYGLIAFATVLLVVTLVRLSRVYRWVGAVLIASVVPPFVANAWFNIAGGRGSVDYTPFLFVVTATVLIGGLFRSRLPQLRPLARSQVFETLPEPVFVLDPYDRLTDANPAAQRLLGAPLASVTGRPLGDLVPPLAHVTGRHARTDESADLVRHDGRVLEVVVSPVTRQRRRTPEANGRDPAPVHDRDVAGRLVVARDVSERQAAQEQLAWQAMHDPLTRLANRRLLVEHVETALARARRAGDEVALLYLDLDDFKDVNDTLGHAAGDAVLVEVAQRIDLTVRAADTTARLGGDEFAVLLDGTTTEGGAVTAAEHVLTALHEPVRLEYGVARPGVSIGVAVGCPGDPEALIGAADSALYRAKRGGRGRLVVQHLPAERVTS